MQKQRVRIDAAVEETKKYEQPIEELRVSDFQREQKMRQVAASDRAAPAAVPGLPQVAREPDHETGRFH